MENILNDIFDNSYPKYTSYQFENMINIGLVLTGVKKGAFTKLDKLVINKLKKLGYYVDSYPKIPHLTWISLHNPNFSEQPTHKEIGKALGYLTPVDIDKDITNKYYINIEIKFRRINSNSLICNTLPQIVVNKTKKQIDRYLQKYINGILKLNIPKEFKIISIKGIVIKSLK